MKKQGRGRTAKGEWRREGRRSSPETAIAPWMKRGRKEAWSDRSPPSPPPSTDKGARRERRETKRRVVPTPLWEKQRHRRDPNSQYTLSCLASSAIGSSGAAWGWFRVWRMTFWTLKRMREHHPSPPQKKREIEASPTNFGSLVLRATWSANVCVSPCSDSRAPGRQAKREDRKRSRRSVAAG